MKTGRDRALNVIAVVDATRELHPELALPITPRRLKRALKAEDIAVLRGRIRPPERVRGFNGAYAITLREDLPDSLAWKWALHAYGHIRLGHFPEGIEIPKHLAPCRRDDPRELEVKLFATLLVLGSTATPETPEVAAIIAKMVGNDSKRRAPAQLPLPIPEGPVEFDPQQRADYLGAKAEENYGQLLARRHRARKARLKTPFDPDRPPSDDIVRIRWDDTRKGIRYEDPEGKFWYILDYRRSNDQWERVRDSKKPEPELRLFVDTAGARRAYRFRDHRELRQVRVKHLDRQIREATQLRRGPALATPIEKPQRYVSTYVGALRVKMVSPTTDACPYCETSYDEGKPAPDGDMCVECALELFGPTPADTWDAAHSEQLVN